MPERISFATREEWLASRSRGIGASEASAIVSLSPWQTPMELWKVKTGLAEPKDLSENAAVERGKRMESALRGMFEASHPEYDVKYHAYDMLFQKFLPWLYATLDGEIKTKDGKRLVLEIKTCAPQGKSGWAEWADGSIKPAYYVQVLHQLLATGYDGVIVYVALYALNGDITIRQYEFDRAECRADMEWLLSKEKTFWKSVQTGQMPGTRLSI